MNEKRVRQTPVCEACGSDAVLADAHTQYDEASETWHTTAVFEKGAYCPDCDGECKIEWVDAVGRLKFEAGKSYSCRSIGDQDCVFKFKVIRRTDKTLWLDYEGKTLTVRARFNGTKGESCMPLGRYSMAPILRPSSVVEA